MNHHQVTAAHARRGFWIIALLALPGLSACEQEGIRQYRVQRLEKKQATSGEISASSGQTAWFFKLMGPEAATRSQLPAFAELIKTVDIAPSGTPIYTLPAGWREGAAEPPRWRTFTIGGTEPPLEVAVSSLPAPDPNSMEYLQLNVNRWRGQLGLPPYASDNWFSEAEQEGEVVRAQFGSNTITLVHLEGETPEFGATRMLTAMITPASSSGSSSSPPPLAATGRNAGFEGEVPEGWTEGPPKQFVLKSYLTKNESGEAEVSVSRAGGGITANINRWCDQLGLPAKSESELAQSSSTIEVDGISGTYIELTGSENSIYGAIIPDGDQKWFFKLRGPEAVVKLEADKFKAFLRTVHFD